MGIMNYFKSVTTLDADRVREMTGGKKPGEFCLLDVRLPKEYERGHIPGAVLIPVGELEERLGELDPRIPTFAYCAIGGRSRAAASILQDAGFDEVYNVKGGFHAWNGLSVEGPPETGTAYFLEVEDSREVLLLAWALEEGTRRFYESMAAITEEPHAKEVYQQLKVVEQKHQQLITDLFHEVSGTVPDEATPFYSRYLARDQMEQLMEGQLKLGEVLEWAKNHDFKDVLEYAAGLEARLYDVYFRLEKKYTQPNMNAVYRRLAEEEKAHLDLFTDLLERHL